MNIHKNGANQYHIEIIIFFLNQTELFNQLPATTSFRCCRSWLNSWIVFVKRRIVFSLLITESWVFAPVSSVKGLGGRRRSRLTHQLFYLLIISCVSVYNSSCFIIWNFFNFFSIYFHWEAVHGISPENVWGAASIAFLQLFYLSVTVLFLPWVLVHTPLAL